VKKVRRKTRKVESDSKMAENPQCKKKTEAEMYRELGRSGKDFKTKKQKRKTAGETQRTRRHISRKEFKKISYGQDDNGEKLKFQSREGGKRGLYHYKEQHG